MIRLHSSVALITNSSTTIYSSATENTVQQIREFINVVLRIAGSDKTCDDLFKLSLVPSGETIDREADSLQCDYNGMDWEDIEDELNIVGFLTQAEVLELVNNPGYSRANELINKAIAAGYTCQFSSEDDYENRPTYDVEVRDLNGNLVDVQSLLNSIDSWDVYC